MAINDGASHRAALPAPLVGAWLTGRAEPPRPATAPAFRKWQHKAESEFDEDHESAFFLQQETCHKVRFKPDSVNLAKFRKRQQPKRAASATPSRRPTLKPIDIMGVDMGHNMPKKRRSSVSLAKIATEDEAHMSKTVQFGLHIRSQDEIGVVLEILKEAMGRDKQEHFRAFAPPYHPNRQLFVAPNDDATLQKKVLRAMKKEGGSIGCISDILQCTPAEWSKLGNLLDGCSLGTVKRCALDHLEQGLTPLDKAATAVSIGWRNPFRFRGRVCHVPRDGTKVHDEQFMVGAY
jgi:hypothetical protein